MRRLQFKFPNQIRIFGWDFGSSARAMNQAGGKDSLMTYESVPTAQADLGKVSRSTTERKSMSTKTSIKRIALVAVAALGFGMVSTVAANAAITGATPTLTTPSITTSVGTNVSSTFTVVTTGTLADGNSVEYQVAISSKPAGSSLAIAAPSSSAAASAKVAFKTGGEASVAGWALTTTNTNFRTDTIATAASGANIAGSIRGTISVTPDVAGTYVFLLSAVPSAGSTGTATLTVVVNGQNAARNAYVADSTTTNDAGSVWNATALSAGTSSTTPGVSYTANGAISGSVATLTVPAAAVIAFDVVGSATWSTGSSARLSMNGSTVATLSCTISTTKCTLDNYTAPSTAGSYSAVLTMSGANASFDPANNLESISFTLTVGASGTGLLDYSNSTTAAAAGVLVVSTVGVTSVSNSGRVGVPISFTPNFTVKNLSGGTLDSNTRAARLVYSLTLPSGSAGTIYDAAVSGTASTKQTVQGQSESLADTKSNTLPNPGTIMYFTPATAGVYTVTVFHDANRDGLLSAGEASVTSSFTVNADALPSVTFTKYGTSTSAALANSTNLGQLVKVSLRNGTAAWGLASNEVLRVTAASSTGKILRSSSFSSAGAASWNALNVTTVDLSASNFNGSGDAYLNVGDTSTLGGTFSYSASIVGGTAAGASGSFTITTIAANDATVTTDYLAFLPVVNASTTSTAGYISDVNAAAGTSDDGTFAATSSDDVSIKPGVTTSVSVGVLIGATNLAYISGTFTDTLGLVTGAAGAKYSVIGVGPSTGAVATSTASISVSIPGAGTAALATGTTVGSLILNDATVASLGTLHTTTIKATTAAQDSIAVNPATLGTTYSVRAAVGSSNKFTATVFDAYGNAMAGVAVNAQVTAGRNVQVVATPLVSDANGQVSFTVADVYTGTLITTDTLAFTSGGKTGTVTINYATYNAPSTVTITGGASADVAPAVTYSYIDTSVSGASNTTVKMTATVKDANGATLPAGVKVTWKLSGITTSGILVDSTTGYDWSTSNTDSNGQAVTYVYGWGTGDVKVSATAGTVTSATAGLIHFANSGTKASEADARVLSVTTSSNVVTAKVVDRYGNPVSGVSLTATRTAGSGYFGGSGASSAVASTGTDGTVDFVIQGGTATVSVKTTTLNTGQTSSASGYVGATAVTSTGVGASLAPAGVQTASVDVAGTTTTSDAIDAANEATDAANAATDAANAAAEAADAATAAAQDAQAAVAALASQVADLISGIKAQLTALSNLVIKIQKKVKA